MTMRAAVVRAFGAADCIEIALNHPKPALTTANSVGLLSASQKTWIKENP